MKKATILSIFAFMTLLSIVPIGFALYPSTTPWSTYRHDVTRSGATPSDPPSSNNTLWASGFSTYGLTVTTTPLVVDGRVIFAVRDLAVAIDETTGVQLWNHPATGVLTAPSYADGRVLFGISEGTGGIICINASTGQEIWNQNLSPYFVNSNPLVHKGTVYAGITDNKTRAFNATTGQLSWSYKTDGPVYSSPAADGDILFFGSTDTKLYALDVSGASPVSLWNFTANGPIQSTPAIANGKVFFGSDKHMLYALDKVTGNLIWSWTTTDTSARVRNGVAVANNIVYVTPECTSGLTADRGKIYALHADFAPGNYTDTDLDMRYWTKQFTGYLLKEPVYANGKIILTADSSEPARLLALDANSGITLWDRIINWWPSLGAAVVADGHVWYSAYWWDAGSFTLYCIGDLFPPTTYLLQVNAGGSSFSVTLNTNSTVTNFNTTGLTSVGEINFKTAGIGTTGMSNITIPKNLLNGVFNVTVDGAQPWYSAPLSSNSTHSSLYFTYNGTTSHTVKITGTTFIPEFPTAVVLPLAAAGLSLVALKLKKIPKHR
jgi:outer membrane protein assembly factor BamB